jgi:hypothetical protein
VLTDDDIDTALADVLPLEESLEDYPGTWQTAPYADRDGSAVLGLGDRSWDVLLDRETDRLQGVPEEADPFLLNTSLDAFVRCVQAAVAAREEITRFQADATDEDDDLEDLAEDDDGTTDEIEEIALRLEARLREIDPAAMADDDGFWAVLAHELGYGV